LNKYVSQRRLVQHKSQTDYSEIVTGSSRLEAGDKLSEPRYDTPPFPILRQEWDTGNVHLWLGTQNWILVYKRYRERVSSLRYS